MTSLALEPPMLLVCMNRESETGRAMAGTGAFAVNILGEDHGELAIRFARKGGDKFSGVELDRGDAGQPLLAGAIAHLECRVTEQVAAGTHTVFIAEVEAATARAGAPPLAYFRGRFGRLELAEDAELQPREPLTEAEIRDAAQARRAIELGVIEQTVGRVSGAAVAALRRLIDDEAAFRQHLVGMAGSRRCCRATGRSGRPRAHSTGGAWSRRTRPGTWRRLERSSPRGRGAPHGCVQNVMSGAIKVHTPTVESVPPGRPTHTPTQPSR